MVVSFGSSLGVPWQLRVAQGRWKTPKPTRKSQEEIDLAVDKSNERPRNPKEGGYRMVGAYNAKVGHSSTGV